MGKQISDFFRIKGSVKSLISSATSGWAKSSEWDGFMISRDLFQNQFDGCNSMNFPISSVTEEIINRDTFRMSSPVTFNLESLYWLGSEKNADENVGQNGEGFKLAATTLLRSHNAQVFTASGTQALEIRLSDKAVGDKETMYPLVYDFYELEEPVDGNVIIITGVSSELLEALKKGRESFYYRDHPGIGAQLNSKNNIKFFERIPMKGETEEESKDGLLFYHSLLRARIPNTPVVIVFNQKYAKIEQTIGVDRDRKVFSEQIRSMLIKQAVESGLDTRGFSGHKNDIDWLLPLMKPYFSKGNMLLSALLSGQSNYYSRTSVTDLWKEKNEKYGHLFEGQFAASPKHSNFEITAIENAWKDEGKKSIPAYFKAVGAPSALIEMDLRSQKQAEEVKSQGSRQPSPVEQKMINVVANLLPEIFSAKEYHYHVFVNETLLGQYKSSRDRDSAEIYLGVSTFEKSSGEFFSTLTHEVLHTKGYDYSNTFSAALTDLIQLMMDSPNMINQLDETLKELMIELEDERESSNEVRDTIARIVKEKDPEELATLVSKVPYNILKGIIENGS